MRDSGDDYTGVGNWLYLKRLEYTSCPYCIHWT